MLVVSLDALVCGLKLPRALRGFVQLWFAAAGLGFLLAFASSAPVASRPLYGCRRSWHHNGCSVVGWAAAETKRWADATIAEDTI